MPFIFERFAVVIGFHAENPDDLTGTEQELVDFDSALSSNFGGFIAAALQDNGLPDTRETRSMVALLAHLSSGAPKTQVKNAAKYFASTRPVLPTVAVAGDGVTDGDTDEPSLRRRGGRRSAKRGAKRGTRRAGGRRRRTPT